MFPSPLLLGLLASQTVSDTPPFQKHGRPLVLSLSCVKYQVEKFCQNGCEFAIVTAYSCYLALIMDLV